MMKPGILTSHYLVVHIQFSKLSNFLGPNLKGQSHEILVGYK